MKYRVFTNDIGPGQYSCFDTVEAENDEQAQRFARALTKSLVNLNGRKVSVLVISENRTDLMPDRKTGRLPK